MAEPKQTRTLVLALILVIALAGAGAYMYMSGGVTSPVETSPAKTEKTAAEKPAAPPRPEPQAADFAAAENAPLTLDALRYVPDDAQMSVGIPPVTSLIANLAPLVQDIFGDEMDVAEELGLIARDLAKDMDVEESDDLAAVLAAMGIDSAKGAAVFLDLDELAQEALDAATRQSPSALPDMSSTKAVAVIPVLDGEKAEACLKKLTNDMLSGVPTNEESAGDVTITLYEGIGGYFLSGGVLAIGNDIEMLKQVAAREKAPAQLRYGSKSCPPDDVHEAAALIYGDKFVPVIEKFVALLGQVQPEAVFFVQTQMQQLKDMYANDTNDPMLLTLSVRDDVIELKSKIDTEMYPALLTTMGTARPLRWAQLLPQNTLAFLTLLITPEAKAQIEDIYLKNLPDELRNQPGVAQGLQFGKPALGMLGQEITFAVTGMDPIDFPTMFLFVEVQNPQQASVFLQMAPQLPHGDPYRDVRIKAVNFPSPIQFYFAMVDDVIIVSNSDAGIREIIDLIKDEKTSGFFESLEPPINPETPVYQALLLKPELYVDLVDPLMALAGNPLPREGADVAATVSSLFKDMRFFSEMQDSWLTTRISVVRATEN
ncbi:MAG TPA: DUF3352 domain-containing protein [Candidatus Hydrogenedentes bacterium]|nr:DUF3352 domain-containing protein [Candidatus Hydrogenedentota bacterium]